MANDIKKGKRIKTARTLVKLLVLALIIIGAAFHTGFGTICAAGIEGVWLLCPLGGLEALLAAKTFIPQAVIAIVCGLVVIILLGRAFCAWVCPVPPLVKFFHPKGNKKQAKSELSESPENEVSADTTSKVVDQPVQKKKIPLDSRHAVLAGALGSSFVFGFPVFCLVCPVGLSFGTVIAIYRAIFEHDPSWMLVVFPVILILELVVFRKWCHTLCPLGALMSLLGSHSLVGRPHVRKEACLRENGKDCHACSDVCPEYTDPHEKALPECTRCGDCATVCPAQSISLKLAQFGSQKEKHDC